MKKQEEEVEVAAVSTEAVRPRDWLELLAVCLVTPILNPGQHINDPTVIWGLPVNTIGLSGIGKSAQIKSLGRIMGFPGVHTIFAATKSTSSFEGALVPRPDGITIECILTGVRRCIANSGGLIFLDEINGASPRVQAAALSALNDRQFGDAVVPPKTRMLCAMNPTEHAAGGFELTAPMANRMGHVYYEGPSPREWADWLMQRPPNIPHAHVWEQQVVANWSACYGQVLALAIGFAEKIAREKLVAQPPSHSPRAGEAWPSLRTRHWALCAITAARCLGKDLSFENELMHCFCGKSAAREWSEWVKEADLPNPQEVLQQGFRVDPHRLDRSYTVIHAAAEWVVDLARRNREAAMPYAAAYWRLLKQADQDGYGDLPIRFSGLLYDAGLAAGDVSPEVAEAAKWLIVKMVKDETIGLTKGT